MKRWVRGSTSSSNRSKKVAFGGTRQAVVVLSCQFPIGGTAEAYLYDIHGSTATLLDELRRHFRPEFLNRVDEVVVFTSLSEQQLEQIVEIQLTRLRPRLADRRITLELTPAATKHLVRVGYDPVYGARPLKRAIQKELETPLGRKILAGEIKDGQSVLVDYDQNKSELTFTAGLPKLPEFERLR